MHSSLSNIRISGLAVSTGSVVRDFRADGLAAGIDPAQLERVAKAIGLRERRVAAPGVTTLDLCEDAARRLLEEMAVDPTSIDALIFVTQTPDYLQPNNSSLLQARLGLCKSVAAFDVTQGCSGWVYGLHQAALLCSHGAARVLVCAGDTLSHQTDPKDTATHPIFWRCRFGNLSGEDGVGICDAFYLRHGWLGCRGDYGADGRCPSARRGRRTGRILADGWGRGF